MISSFFGFLCELFTQLADLAWRCRLSVVSIFIGVAVFVLFSESHDLLLENIGTTGLLKYAALLSVVWAMQVYVSARSSIPIAADPVAEENGTNKFLKNVPNFFPLALSLLCFLAVLIGIYLAQHDILVCENIQSRSTLHSCLGYANSNDLLQFDSTLQEGKTPSVYSLPEVSTALAQLWQVALFVVAAAVMFVLVAFATDHRISGAIRLRRSPTLHRGNDTADSDAPSGRLFRLLNTVVMGGFFLWTFYRPFDLTDWAGRASLIPILLGSWIPVVALAGETSRWLQSRLHIRWPLATTALILLLVASSYAETFNDVRIYQSKFWQAAQADQGGKIDDNRQRQIDLNPAIDRWMKLNGCENHPADCKMFLVAAEGGASRSAFFTGTILGAIMDEAARHPDRYPDFSRAIFAMSGVSGGSVGLTLLRTALAESKSGRPPCKTADSIWFGVMADGKIHPERDPTKSWRACLQLLAAGDFLSPTIVGLFPRDQFALLVEHDRAVLLEQSIERHYNHIVHGTRTPCQGPEDERGLCSPFGYLQQKADAWLPLLLLNAASKDTGRPILVSDIATALTTKYTPCPDLFMVAHNAFELFASNPFAPSEPVADEMGSCVYGRLERAADLRLSTAAVLSARFPIVSPAGSFRFKNEYKNFITASAVDGGYFDNSGVSTLNRIIPVLLARGITPTVLNLTNAPWFYKATERGGRSFAGQSRESQVLSSDLQPPDQSSWKRAFSIATEPLRALYQTRAGHQASAMETLIMRHPEVDLRSIRVMRGVYRTRWPETAAGLCIDTPPSQATNTISLYQPVMSWWLSPITQRALDAQLCDQRNINDIRFLLERFQLTPS